MTLTKNGVYADRFGHDYFRVTRADGMERMECVCGKRSRWSELAEPVRRAVERHAKAVAR